MFGLEYITAFIKIAFQIAFAIISAIPFNIAWNSIAPIYMTFLPKVYHNIPYWKFVGIILVCSFLGEQISKLVPKIIEIKSEQNNKG